MIKLNQKLKENPVFKNARLFKFYVELLFEAEAKGMVHRETLSMFEAKALAELKRCGLIRTEESGGRCGLVLYPLEVT